MAKLVTISNSLPRLDTDGNVIDCHSGMILAVNGTFFMYGERYTNSTGFGPSPPQLFPKIVVYTSLDMSAWSYRGEVLQDWPTKPYGTFFTPWAVYNKATNTFVLWFNAYLHGCCSGDWGVATSADGVHFNLQTTSMTGKYKVVDCNALFVDDDGGAFLLYTSEDQDHKVSIEGLAANYSAVVPGGNKGLFPDRYIEGAVLFKRGDTYYMSEGSCCCFCRGGAGVVVYKSKSLDGPWQRQPLDLNCDRTDAGDICGAYGDRDHDPIRVQAQGIGLSLIPLANGSTAYLWHGERSVFPRRAWNGSPLTPPPSLLPFLRAGGYPLLSTTPLAQMSARRATRTRATFVSSTNTTRGQQNPRTRKHPKPKPYRPLNPTEQVKGQSFSYWIPLAFDDSTGDVLPFAPFVDSFTLDVAEGFDTAHLPGPGSVHQL